MLKPSKLTKRQKATLYSMYIDWLLTQNENDRYGELDNLKKAVCSVPLDSKSTEKHFDLFFERWAYTENINLDEL
jgi:hypothetical protein